MTDESSDPPSEGTAKGGTKAKKPKGKARAVDGASGQASNGPVSEKIPGGKRLKFPSGPTAEGVEEEKPKGGSKVLRLPVRHGQILRLAGMEMPAARLQEGEILLIENASEAERYLADPKFPEHARPASQEAVAVGVALMRELQLAQNLAELEANDRDNAERLLARYPHDLIMVRNKGFHAWNGRIYDSETADPRSFHLAGETAKAIHGEARFLAEPSGDEGGKARKERQRFAKTSGNHRAQVAMLEQVGKKRSFSVDDLDRDPLLIVVRNGTIRLRRPAKGDDGDDGPLLEFTPHHDPADYATHWIDADYIEGAPCPRWKAFLERTQPDQEQRLFLQTFAGYCLTGLMDWQGFVIHYGTGANGKSVYGDAIGKILGSACVSVSPESFLARNQRQGDKASPDLVRLVGKRCVQIFEYKEAEPLDEAALKRITGGDKMVVRGLHKDPIEFRPRFKIEIFANEKPRIKGTYEGIWRRIHLVNWPVKIPDEEKREPSELQAEFDEERSGILNYVLDGAMHFLEAGLRVPDSIRAATAEYRDDSDPVGLFIRDCVEETPGQRVSGAYMYDSFGKWCDANGVRRMAVQHFAPKMLEHGMIRQRANGSMWLDVRLHDVPQTDLMDPLPPD